MGYAEGGDTLEYVLDYARKLHGLPGGITPAQIWKTYMQVIMKGEPVEQFDGVKIPEKEDPAKAPEPGAKNYPDAARKRAPVAPRAPQQAPKTRRAAASASASASSVAPSKIRPPRAKRAGAARSSASAAPR
jgi:membrane peptidoglycan carboxypeptidase